jgi:hypothetical protein
MTLYFKDGILTSVTGIKPIGVPHPGNYIGSIGRALENVSPLQENYMVFAADPQTIFWQPKNGGKKRRVKHRSMCLPVFNRLWALVQRSDHRRDRRGPYRYGGGLRLVSEPIGRRNHPCR